MASAGPSSIPSSRTAKSWTLFARVRMREWPMLHRRAASANFEGSFPRRVWMMTSTTASTALSTASFAGLLGTFASAVSSATAFSSSRYSSRISAARASIASCPAFSPSSKRASRTASAARASKALSRRVDTCVYTPRRASNVPQTTFVLNRKAPGRPFFTGTRPRYSG